MLGVVLILYGARRFVRVEEALEAGEFVPLDARDALALGGVAAILSVATLALVFVH